MSKKLPATVKHGGVEPEVFAAMHGYDSAAAMADPIAIFDTDNDKSRKNDDLVFMLDLKDANGATVVVPVALNANGKLGVQINRTCSKSFQQYPARPCRQ